MRELFFVIYYLYFGITIVSLVLSSLLFRITSSSERIIIYFLLFSSLFFITEYCVVFVFNQPSFFVGSIWTVAQFLLFITYYRKIENLKQTQYLILALVFLAVAVTFLVFFNNENSSSLKHPAGIIVLFLSILQFYRYLKHLQEDLLKNPEFWINTAIFLFFSGTFVVYLLIEYLTKYHPDYVFTGWLFHNVMGILRVVLFGYAFYLIYTNHRLQKQNV